MRKKEVGDRGVCLFIKFVPTVLKTCGPPTEGRKGGRKGDKDRERKTERVCLGIKV